MLAVNYDENLISFSVKKKKQSFDNSKEKRGANWFKTKMMAMAIRLSTVGIG